MAEATNEAREKAAAAFEEEQQKYKQDPEVKATVIDFKERRVKDLKKEFDGVIVETLGKVQEYCFGLEEEIERKKRVGEITEDMENILEDVRGFQQKLEEEFDKRDIKVGEGGVDGLNKEDLKAGEEVLE